MKVGVRVYDRKAVYPGLNFCVGFTPPRAYVMDMTGNLIHTWEADVSGPGLN